MADRFVSPDGGAGAFDGGRRPCVRLQAALDAAQPGDVIRLAAGRYGDPAVATRSGAAGAPITLRGEPGAVLDGGRRPRRSSADYLAPNDGDWCFLRLMETAHLVVERLRFENCWPCAIYGRGVSDLIVRDVDALHGQFFLYLRRGQLGSDRRSPSRRITLERVRWVQDPAERMWRGVTRWVEVKNPDHPAACLNGALLGGYAVAGDIRLTGCAVRHAFNGIRLDAPKGSTADSGFNVGVRIENCDFAFIRDNAIEPEKTARDWIVAGCRLLNVHAAFSLHGFTGGWITILGNTAHGAEKPRDSSNVGGRVFKFDKTGPFVEGPICIAHNSFNVISSYIKSGWNENLLHANNLISLRGRGAHPFMAGGERMIWRPSWRWYGDVCDHADFPGGYPPAWGYAIAGARAADIFTQPDPGDFAPRPDADAAAAPVALPRATGDALTLGPGLRVGAWQGFGAAPWRAP